MRLRKKALLMGCYIDDAGEGGLIKTMATLQQDCPLPLHPYPLPPEKRGKAITKTRNEQSVGLHFDFARRLPQSYILKLLDRWKKKTFLNLFLNGRPSRRQRTTSLVVTRGSPLIEKNAEIVGLIFDGNIFSLGGYFGYDAAKNRCVAVDTRVLLDGLRKVYHLKRIADEIERARR